MNTESAQISDPELASHGLKALTAHIGHEFDQHHAQADAVAAGRVLLAMMEHANASTPGELLQRAGMEPKRFGNCNPPLAVDPASAPKKLIDQQISKPASRTLRKRLPSVAWSENLPATTYADLQQPILPGGLDRQQRHGRRCGSPPLLPIRHPP